jgi:hypothetical protein
MKTRSMQLNQTVATRLSSSPIHYLSATESNDYH